MEQPSLFVGPFNTVGPKTITIAYSGDTFTNAGSTTTTVTVTEAAPTATTTTATAGAMTYGTAGSVNVTVTPAGSTGTVTVRNGATVLGTGTLNGAGSVQVAIPGTSLEPGSHTLSVSYGGDTTHAASSGTVTIVVSKASSNTAATANPVHVTVNTGTSTITVVVGSGGGTATGTVQAYVGGNLVDSGPLASGMATLTVGPFTTTGAKTVEVRYLGDAHIAPSQDTATVIVDPPAKIVPKMGISAHAQHGARPEDPGHADRGCCRGRRAGQGFHQDRDPGHGRRLGHHVGRSRRWPGRRTAAEVPGPGCEADPGHLPRQRDHRQQGRRSTRSRCPRSRERAPTILTWPAFRPSRTPSWSRAARRWRPRSR